MTSAVQSRSTVDVPSPSKIRVMSALIWVTTLAIFCQAIIAGQFVSQDGRDGWITVHGVVADASWVLTLISAVYAYVALRHQFPVLVRASVLLFFVTLAQTGIGHLITDSGMDWLIAIHVPLAFVVFAATGYLSVWAVRVHRQSRSGILEHAVAIGIEPKADVHQLTEPVLPSDAL